MGDRISGRGLAAALAALLLTTLSVASPAASYTYPANTFGPTAVGLSCRDYVGGAGTGATPTTYTGTFTFSQSPATPDIAQATTVTLAAANGPTAAATTAAGTYTVTATAALSGAIGGSVELATSTSVDNYPAAAVAAGNPLGPWTATGIYSPSLAGALQVAVNQIVFDDGKYGTGSGTNTDRYCSDPAASGTGSPLPANPNPKDNPVLSEVGYTASINGPVASVTAISGQRSGVTGFARPGETITLSGQDWPVNETDFTAQLCTSGGATPCDAAAETLTANASGALSGTVAVPTGATVGVRGLRISTGSAIALVPVTVLGQRVVTTSPAGAAAGTSVTVSGSNFDPLADIEVRGYLAAGPTAGNETADPAVTGTTSGSGSFSGSYLINDEDTRYIAAYETAPDGNPTTDRASTPFSTIPAGSEPPPAGALSMQTFATGSNPDNETVTVPTSTVGLAPVTVTAPLNRIRVTDDRSSAFGWSLTATATDLQSPLLAFVDSGVLSISPTCQGLPGSAAGATAGDPNQTFDGTVTLCIKDTQTSGGNTNGEWDVTGDIVASLPPFLAAGQYEGTITFTLVG